jgi:hypothetical protein
VQWTVRCSRVLKDDDSVVSDACVCAGVGNVWLGVGGVVLAASEERRAFLCLRGPM